MRTTVRMAGRARPARAGGADGPTRLRPTRVHFTALKTWQITSGAAVLGLVVAGGAVLSAGPWDSAGQRTAERDWAAAGRAHEDGVKHGVRAAGAPPEAAPSAPPVLTPVGTARGGSGREASGTAPSERTLGALLDPLLSGAALGDRRTASVVDVATGRQVYGKAPDQVLIPASTIKVATAVAALSALGTDHRITTRAVLEGGDRRGQARVVLVGGGDPTLTARADALGWGRPDGGGGASLRTLAAATARGLKARHIDRVTLAYDVSLYRGPRMHPIGTNENLAPVTALMADEGRLDDSFRGPTQRTTDPEGAAAGAFAGFLKQHGIDVAGKPAAARATGGAQRLAAVSSPPLSALVERMLTNSDNDIGEALARQTALAAHQEVSFAGSEKAVLAELRGLGLPVSGARIADGSGLDRADRASARLLTGLLRVAGAAGHPELRTALTGLPVAGFTGTLEHRYEGGADRAGMGLVRAKTGTLTGVNTLAGTVVDRDGRLLAFAFMTEGSTSPAATQNALDHAAVALASCGCG